MSKRTKKVVGRLMAPVGKIISPIEDFLKMEASAGVILMIITLIAMVWANSPFYHYYETLLEFQFGVSIGSFSLIKSLHHWVNDGLMVIFFFVVGLEIKREIIHGELSTLKKAALPMFAALGGMVVPALIYTYFNHSGVGKTGWGIPMATDIAFAVGVLSLLSKRVPFALKIFLLALAIVDDLGAVLVIAFFYTEQISGLMLGIATLTFCVTYMLRLIGVRHIGVYLVLGVIAWLTVFKSGVHATIAGVLLGLMTPVDPLHEKDDLPDKLHDFANTISNDINSDSQDNLSHSAGLKLHELKNYTYESISPLDRLIHTLHPWVSYFIMPLFALVNAGVHIEGVSMSSFLSNDIAVGVILGLFLGKPLGVLIFSGLAVKFNLASLPRGVTWKHMTAVGCLAGIGFTMALFVGHLALKVPEMEVYSKLGIIVASSLSAAMGLILLLTCEKQES